MAGLHAGLVLLVAAGLVPGGLLLLRRLAAESAAARVQLAASGALEGLRLQEQEVLTAARLLAERPTLARLLREERADELAGFLERFRATSDLDGCAIVRAGALAARSPGEAAWPALLVLDAGPGARLVPPAAPGEAPLAIARVPLSGGSEGEALAFRRLGASLAGSLASQVGLPVRILAPAPASSVARGADGAWRARLSAEGERGEVGVEVELPAADVASVLRPLERRFALVTAVAVLAAAAVGALAARALSRPLDRLRAAAARIEDGDLSTPVPALAGVETGLLAATMEGMRRTLQRTGAALREREHEARALLEGMVEGVFAVDGERRLQYLSPPAARRLGVEPGQALGRFCGDVLRPRRPDGSRPCDEDCPIVHARSRGSSRAVEHLELAAGRRVVVVTSAPPIGARQVQLLRDETETEAARRSRDAVLANVSHELKTPLSAQMASVQLLQDALGESIPAEALELVAALERSTLRLTRLIDNLLESVRIETGRATLRAVPVDLRDVIAEAEATTSPLFVQRRQEVLVELPEALARVRGDPVQLLQVFVNLLSNANKFSPEGTTIRVGGASDAQGALVWVEDAGPGIAPEERRSIFEHAYRSDPQAAEGMGLGLWIVKAIVERHGGSVHADAGAVGGARLCVRLPGTTA